MARRQPGSIELAEGALTITGELDWSLTARFDEECQRLVQSGIEEPLVDLAGVTILTSPFLGILSQAAVQCLSRDQKLTLRIPARLLSVFDALNFETFSIIEVV